MLEMAMSVEFATAPLAIGTRTPRFSWEVPLTRRGVRQSAYQVLVASARNLVALRKPDLWDSGRVRSSQSTNVPYDGVPLQSNQDCFWAVRIWDETDDEVVTSRVEYFGTALYDPSDWNARVDRTR